MSPGAVGWGKAMSRWREIVRGRYARCTGDSGRGAREGAAGRHVAELVMKLDREIRFGEKWVGRDEG